jgi:Flp pilus assembly protein TadD
MLQEAARVKPNYWEARYLLGVELAAQGSIREARVEFEEAVRLRPDLPAGHFNLGVALAKLGVFEEAAAQFTETMRLDPKHAQARAFLQKLEQARSGLPPARN